MNERLQMSLMCAYTGSEARDALSIGLWIPSWCPDGHQWNVSIFWRETFSTLMDMDLWIQSSMLVNQTSRRRSNFSHRATTR